VTKQGQEATDEDAERYLQSQTIQQLLPTLGVYMRLFNEGTAPTDGDGDGQENPS